MTRVYLADASLDERSALRLMLLDLSMEVVGEADDWNSTVANAPATGFEMLVVDWDLLPIDLSAIALASLRKACANPIVEVLISHLSVRLQALRSPGADAFISRGDMIDVVSDRLRLAAAMVSAE